MNLRIFDDHESLSAAFADEVLQRIERKPGSTVLLTGGSTARRAYELLGSMPRRPRVAAQPVVWVMTDERMVPPYHADSNGRMIQESLFRLGIPAGHRFIRFRTDLGDPARVARELEAELRDSIDDGAADLALLGVGEDGHTASLFPGTDVLEESRRWAREVWVPRLDAWRVTLTAPVIRRAAERWIVASGAQKRAIIGAIRDGADVPLARVVGEGETWWFVDRAAWDPEESLAAERGGR